LLDLAEAARVRALGWAAPVMSLKDFFEAPDLPECARLGLQFTVHCDGQLRLLELYLNSATAKFEVYLKMNSRMNRLGFQPAKYQ
jgi:alanine racemase